MTTKYRDFIRNVRNCKTVSEERAIIQREMAAIRAIFKEGKEHYRIRCMLKLLYITMLGYSTEFGQMEVIKLIAQPQYSGKRIGYLTMAIILDECSEVITLAENHIKKDLSNENHYIASLALDTVANIAGEDMSRDVLHEVTSLISSSNLYIKKKACLAALRIVKKAPEHSETFCEYLPQPFNERNHGALMCSLALINECLKYHQADRYLPHYRSHIPVAVRILKQAILSSKITDYDIQGICDPFLQVRILQFLRIVGANDRDSIDAMNDVLAQVITNTDNSKNVGNAILYEAARTIISLDSDESLRSMAITTLGRFLTSTNDNNLRFVALSSLLKVIQQNPNDIQKLHVTILDCLKDIDYSIRRLALQLTIALIDDYNIRIVVPDLLVYLGSCSDEGKNEVTKHLCNVILNQAPTPEWRVEMSLKLFKATKNSIPTSFALDYIAHISRSSQAVQTQCVTGLWEEFNQPYDSEHQLRSCFIIVAVWCIGEYTQYLVTSAKVAPKDIAKAIICVAAITQSSTTIQYCLTSLIKVTSKYQEIKNAAKLLFEKLTSNQDCEIQQRALEYIAMIDEFPELLMFTFSAMPAIENVESETETLKNVNVTVVTEEEVKKEKNEMASLENIFGGGTGSDQSDAGSKASSPTDFLQTANQSVKKPALDFDDLFGNKLSTDNAPKSNVNIPNNIGALEIFDAQKPPQKEIFRNDLFIANLSCVQQGPRLVKGILSFVSLFSDEISNFCVFIAVPKTCSLELKNISSTVLQPKGCLVQEFNVINSNDKPNFPLMIRVKVEYTLQGISNNIMFQGSYE